MYGYKSRKLKKKKLMSDINITPLVDIMLVLLIAFMIAAPMLNNGFDVNLPKVSSNQVSLTKKEQIIFSIDNKNQIRIDDRVLTLDAINNYLKNYNPNNTQVFIKGDKGSDYGVVIELMSLINKNGFLNLSLVTIPLKN